MSGGAGRMSRSANERRRLARLSWSNLQSSLNIAVVRSYSLERDHAVGEDAQDVVGRAAVVGRLEIGESVVGVAREAPRAAGEHGDAAGIGHLLGEEDARRGHAPRSRRSS